MEALALKRGTFVSPSFLDRQVSGVARIGAFRAPKDVAYGRLRSHVVKVSCAKGRNKEPVRSQTAATVVEEVEEVDVGMMDPVDHHTDLHSHSHGHDHSHDNEAKAHGGRSRSHSPVRLAHEDGHKHHSEPSQASSSTNGATTHANGSIAARRGKGASNSAGASSVSSGVRLENITKTFKGMELLKDVSWEVKKGERVGLVGVNGAGKTSQLKIIFGEIEPDSGVILKARHDMKIAYLTQEFDVVPGRTVQEEFESAFAEAVHVRMELERVQAALEDATEDMDLMSRLLDELDELQKKAEGLGSEKIDSSIAKVMPELGFGPDDVDRLVASYSGGWQMRMSLGKILLQVRVTHGSTQTLICGLGLFSDMLCFHKRHVRRHAGKEAHFP